MARTTRDEIWRATLDQTIRHGVSVSPSEIAEETDASERTVRECLLSMYESDWLERLSTPSGEVRYRAIPAVKYGD
jgi:DNA-binding GntR family transcriptional regulator